MVRLHAAAARRSLLWHGGLDYAPVDGAVRQHGCFKLATFLFMVALLYHAWVGMRNISMDYVKPIAVSPAAADR